MSKYSRSSMGSLPVRFLSESFPIIGNATPDIAKQIEEERRISAHDLWMMAPDVWVGYNLPFQPTYDEHDYPIEDTDLHEITVRRENASVILDVVAHAGIHDRKTGRLTPHCDFPTFIAATAKIPVGRILRIVKEYAEYHLGNSDIISDFAKAGMLNKVEQVDRGRQLLHYDIGRIIQEALADGPIVFGRDHNQTRYLATALMMHVLPSSLYEQLHFMEMNVGVKFKDTDDVYRRNQENREEYSPFKLAP